MKQQIATDLEKFHKAFGREGRKLGEKIEYRVPDLDQGLQEAKWIIVRMDLNLIATCEGNMAKIRAFVVKPL